MPVKAGITSCQNCLRVIDTSLKNRLLSASWACRRNHLQNASEYVREHYELDDNCVAFLERTVIHGSMSPDEFLKEIKAVGL